MKVAVTGATGNVGTSVLDALLHDPQVTEVIGIARRRPELSLARTRCRFAPGTDRRDRAPNGAETVRGIGPAGFERQLRSLFTRNDA